MHRLLHFNFGNSPRNILWEENALWIIEVLHCSSLLGGNCCDVFWNYAIAHSLGGECAMVGFIYEVDKYSCSMLLRQIATIFGNCAVACSLGGELAVV